MRLLEWLATASAAFFAGAALYVSIVEHPARMKAGVAVALAEFRPSYKRAAPVQASAAAICLVSSVSVSLLTWEWPWALGGLLVGAAIPFTLLAIMPTNRRLLDTAATLEHLQHRGFCGFTVQGFSPVSSAADHQRRASLPHFSLFGRGRTQARLTAPQPASEAALPGRQRALPRGSTKIYTCFIRV